jgi:uncharacterized protein DUF202
MRDDAPPPLDPGLANERTRLASSRTALSFAVVAALAARAGWDGGVPMVGYVAAGILLVVAAALTANGLVAYRVRHVTGLDGPTEDARPRTMRALAAASTFAAVAGFILAIAVH